MVEAGIDISGQYSKHVDELTHIPFDFVVTVCDDANKSCPISFVGRAKIIHRSFDDPPRLAAGARTEEQRLAPYRRVSDEIREYVARLPDRLEGETRQIKKRNDSDDGSR
jgi:arsenate reductase